MGPEVVAMGMKVSEVARLAGVSVRTLHHYDEIGLLRPGGRSAAGYRLYRPEDLARLQQVLFFRELGFPLEEIVRTLSGSPDEVTAALREQRRLLASQAARAGALLAAIDRALEEREGGSVMTDEERFELFGAQDPARHEAEVRARWGQTEAFAESARRTRRYGAREWGAIQAEAGELSAALARLAEAGAPAGGPEAMALAEAHRAHLERWFYPCPAAMHRGLGDLYVDDARFAASYERVRPGLAAYLRDAIRANAGRLEAGGAA